MKNNSGFSITEVLVSLAILIVLSITLVPLSSFVSYEREILSHKRVITYQLYDELQTVIWNGMTSSQFKRNVEHIEVTFGFTLLESNIIQGCAKWTNIKNREEEICLYGIQEF
ncbi:type II secretion system protein [Ornithinibacillus sp. 179-J 7C1 HS]|uniref:type II secretion system protein n=1 Tax=Ornithinibacillus sp. 179-J 7C1 HS TaxID=3142384 RepID=UPI0039A09B2C